MNYFELFTMMFFVFDGIYDDLPNDKKNLPPEKWQDDIGMYLSELNPFAWESCDSADPAYFYEFVEFIKDKTINDDYGYDLICEYLKTENYYHNVLTTFKTYPKDNWIEACKEYLQTEHKGSDWTLDKLSNLK